jgi:hypothetical protein
MAAGATFFANPAEVAAAIDDNLQSGFAVAAFDGNSGRFHVPKRVVLYRLFFKLLFLPRETEPDRGGRHDGHRQPPQNTQAGRER